MALTRNFTINFPEDLAQKVDELASLENRNTSELFLEAFRVYLAGKMRERMQATQELAQLHNPEGYTQADTRCLLREARQELKVSRRS